MMQSNWIVVIMLKGGRSRGEWRVMWCGWRVDIVSPIGILHEAVNIRRWRGKERRGGEGRGGEGRGGEGRAEEGRDGKRRSVRENEDEKE